MTIFERVWGQLNETRAEPNEWKWKGGERKRNTVENEHFCNAKRIAGQVFETFYLRNGL